MEINYTKSTFTHITNKKTLQLFSYNVGKNNLKNVDTFKYLGVTIAHNLQWHKHINNVCSTASQKLYFLRKKLEHATKDVKLIAYKTFIRPSLEYACVVWSPHQKVLKDKLERIQRMAARFISSRYRRRDSVTEMLNSCGLESLENRRKKSRLKLFFQIIQGHFKIKSDRYVQPPGRRSARTSHTRSIKPYDSRIDVFRYSFFPDVIEIWNALPVEVVEQSEVHKFERSIDILCRGHPT